jgi:glycosyltransferase involved in cell wall biosynthesis
MLAGMTLRIAAKIDFADRGYFHDQIAPLLGTPHADYIGEIGETKKADFLGNALALVFPIDWPEPFGLVMIEALACGTPVIGFNRGSVPEIIEHGVTGFVVDCVEEAAEAVQLVRSLDRATVRKAFEQRFSAEMMAQAYETAYLAVLSGVLRPTLQSPNREDVTSVSDLVSAERLKSSPVSEAAA